MYKMETIYVSSTSPLTEEHPNLCIFHCIIIPPLCKHVFNETYVFRGADIYRIHDVMTSLTENNLVTDRKCSMFSDI